MPLDASPRFSVVIPARNEAKRIGACLESVQAAGRPYAGQVEIIVVLNRCEDATGDIARRYGAKTIPDSHRNLSKTRNAGARHATGAILVTIDADSRMSPNMFLEVDRAIRGGRYIGGGVPIFPERWSVGILLTGVLLVCLLPGLSAGLFWCKRSDFEAMGGFNESLRVGEDVDFARRLRAYGRLHGKRFGTLWKTRLTTSCRKFDTFGDGFALRHPRVLWRGLRGIDTGWGDRIFYDYSEEDADPL